MFQKINILFLSIILLSGSGYLNAQDSKLPVNLGGYIGINANLHNGDYFEPNSVVLNSNEQIYDNPTSLGLNGGFIINYPINEIFTFSGRLGLHGAGANFLAEDSYSTNNTIDSNYSDDFETSLLYGELDLFMQFHNIIPVDNLYLLAGLELGFPITAEYERQQSISINDTETIVSSTGEIPEAAIRAAIALGAGYTMEIDDNIFLSPEVSFRLPFTDVSSADALNEWNVPQIRAGISLTFGLEDEEEPTPESEINVGFNQIRAYDQNGEPYEVDNIRVEEVQYTELFPIIPYVFFNQESADPAPETTQLAAENEAGTFQMENLEADAISINQQTLDIIGKRMQEYENSKITITGTRDSKTEKGMKSLSEQRAEFAKNYLVVNYGISPDRITLESRGLPAKPSSQRVPEGIAENRRVEFSSEDPTLLDPVLIEKDRQSIATPNIIEFDPYINSTDSVKSWQLELSQQGRIIKSYTGNGNPNELQWAIKPNELMASELPVEYSFFAENERGKTGNKTGSIPVEYVSTSKRSTEEKPDKTVSKFSLVVFDFDSPEISEHDKKIIENNILPAIEYNSTVQIYGYSDKIGAEDYNKKLALNRAKNVKEYLESKAKSARYEVYGIGENIQPYDNDLTIGRQLSRTVQVYVITPKEN